MLIIDKNENVVEVHGDLDVITTDLYNLFKALCQFGISKQEIIRCVAMAYVMLEGGDQDD